MSFRDYVGPTVFGYETDGLRRIAFVSVHTSPLAVLGQKDAGGMNVYVRELAHHLGQLGLAVDIYTRRTDPTSHDVTYLAKDVRVINITAGPAEPVDKQQLFPYLPEFARQAALFSMSDGVRYDVVHAHYWLSGWTAHLMRRYWDAPMVQMFHTTAHMKNAVLAQADRYLRPGAPFYIAGPGGRLGAAFTHEIVGAGLHLAQSLVESSRRCTSRLRSRITRFSSMSSSPSKTRTLA